MGVSNVDKSGNKSTRHTRNREYNSQSNKRVTVRFVVQTTNIVK